MRYTGCLIFYRIRLLLAVDNSRLAVEDGQLQTDDIPIKCLQKCRRNARTIFYKAEISAIEHEMIDFIWKSPMSCSYFGLGSTAIQKRWL
jgi:hypothetical protein